MTRARALKEVIRARVAKTGERYTTARRHVLKEVRPRTAALIDRSPKGALPALPAPAKGGVSDATSREKTGYGLDHWFDVLDRFGAVDSPASKGIIVRADGLGRYRYKWGDTTVQLYLIPKGAKVSVVVTNSKLAQTAMIEERRAKWRAALEGLAQVFLTSRKRSA